MLNFGVAVALQKMLDSIPRSVDDYYPRASTTPHLADSSWGASWFLVSLLRTAVPLNPVVTVDIAQQILDKHNSNPANQSLHSEDSVSINTLLRKGFLRLTMGSLVIPSFIERERSKPWQSERSRMSAIEYERMNLIAGEIEKSSARFWISQELAEKIRNQHLTLFSKTPSFDSLIKQDLISAKQRGSEDGFTLMLTAGENSLWTLLISHFGGLLWAQLCDDSTFQTDEDRFSHWYQRVCLIESWNHSPQYLSNELRNRLIDSALNTLLSESDLMLWKEEQTRLVLDVGYSWPLPSDAQIFDVPQQWLAWSYVQRLNWWHDAEYSFPSQNIPNETRVVYIFIIQMIIQYGSADGGSDRFTRIRKLLAASAERPILAHWIPEQLLCNYRGALAWLLTAPECAGLGLALLSRMPASFTLGGDWEKHTIREQKLREVLWSDAVDLFIETLVDSVEQDQKTVAHAVLDPLLGLVRFSTYLHGSSSNKTQPQFNDILFAKLLSAVEAVSFNKGYHNPGQPLVAISLLLHIASQVVQELVTKAGEDPRYDAVDFPDTEMYLLLELMQSILRKSEEEHAAQSLDLAIRIVKLYHDKLVHVISSKKRRTLSGPIIFRRFFLPRMAKHPVWVKIFQCLSKANKQSLLISPCDFPEEIRATYKAGLDAVGQTTTLHYSLEHDLESSWHARIQFHLCLLLGIHKEVTSGRSAEIKDANSSENDHMGEIEQKVAEVLEEHQETNLFEGRVKLFDWSLAGITESNTPWSLISQTSREVAMFKEPLRTEILTRWLGGNDDLGLLLAAAGEFLPAHAITMIHERLEQVDVDLFFKGLRTIHNIIDFTNHAMSADLVSIADKIIDWGDRVTKGHPHRRDWLEHVFRLRMIQFYRRRDQESLLNFPIPDLGNGDSKEITSKFNEHREFFLGLLKLDDAPHESVQLFEKLQSKDSTSLAVKLNLHAARLRLAAKIVDTPQRDQMVQHAVAEWEKVETTLDTSALEMYRPQIAYHRLLAAILLKQDSDIKKELAGTPNYLKYTLDYLRLCLGYLAERKLTMKGSNIIDEAKSYHKMEGIEIPLEMQKLFNDFYESNQILVNPTAGVSEEIEEKPERYRSVFLRMQKLPARYLAYVVEDHNLPETLLLYHHEVSKVLLERKSSLREIKDENKYNDYFESLLRARVTLLSWGVKDQSRAGTSDSGGTGKAASGTGERDWVVTDHRGSTLAITEALRLNSLEKDKLDKHIEKLFRYDDVGLEQAYLIVYFEGSDFDEFCKKYKEYIGKKDFLPWKISEKEMATPHFIAAVTRNLPIYRIQYKKAPLLLSVYHIIINLGSGS